MGAGVRCHAPARKGASGGARRAAARDAAPLGSLPYSAAGLRTRVVGGVPGAPRLLGGGL
jgi:hypothetical protein